jgi:hypothetical protein
MAGKGQKSVTLPDSIYEKAKEKAEKLDIPVSRYVGHLILNACQEAVPT